MNERPARCINGDGRAVWARCACLLCEADCKRECKECEDCG